MPVWEIRIERKSEQTRDGKTRTVGTYQVCHDGQPATGTLTVDGKVADLHGTTAEPKGPSQNATGATEQNPSRILARRYPIKTSGGPTYFTNGYREDLVIGARMPGIELADTDNRTDILIHPGKEEFLSSIGCINLCTHLDTVGEIINYRGSRRRVIALIEDMKQFLGNVPTGPDQTIPNAFVTISEHALTTAEAPAAGATGIGWPLKRNVIRGNVTNHAFGMVRNGGTRPHQGWDLLAPIGTRCFAIADGKIETIYKSDTYGHVVVLAFRLRDKKRFAAYAHLSAVEVTDGQAVTKGQLLGLTGDSGNAHSLDSSQMHLHFEIRTEPRPGVGLGGRVDPIQVFGAIPLHAPVDV